MQNPKNTIDLLVKIFFLVSIVALFSIVFFLSRDVRSIKSTVNDLPASKETVTVVETKEVAQDSSDNQEITLPVTQSCSDTCKVEINQMIAEAIEDIPASAETVIREIASVSKTPYYIPLGGVTATTTSTDWVDIKGTETWIDAKSEYGESAYFSWELSLKVAHGNGQAFARLYDNTNKIAVNGSELTTTDNVDFVLVASSKLNLWAGRNQYLVQLKSLNSFEVTYSGGRIKVSY